MLSQKVPPKYVSIMRELYSHTTGRVRAYGQLSECFETNSGVRQGFPLSPFLLNFVMDDILGRALKSTAANLPNAQDETLFDLEYADDIVCTFETFTDAQSLLNSLICSAARYGLKFGTCEVQNNVIQLDITCLLTFHGRWRARTSRKVYLSR